MKCPHCGSGNIHTISNTHHSDTGFNGCLACIGVLLFNWIGLLCGFCGNDSHTTHHVEHLCQDCGKRF